MLVEIVCRTGECSDIVVRSQSHPLFLFLLKQILEHKLPYREEIEFMYTKVVLKPLEPM